MNDGVSQIGTPLIVRNDDSLKGVAVGCQIALTKMDNRGSDQFDKIIQLVKM